MTVMGGIEVMFWRRRWFVCDGGSGYDWRYVMGGGDSVGSGGNSVGSGGVVVR